MDDGVRGLQTTDQTGPETVGQRLNSWKEIAAFFGKDERTVKRWEAIRGLPIRRVPGGTRTSVFAYVSELEAWLSAPRPLAAPPAADAAAPPSSRPLRLPLAAAIGIIVLLVIGLVATLELPPKPAPAIPSEAKTLYDAGVIAWTSRTASGFATAIEKFDAALAIAPNYAQAEVGRANVYNLISQYTLAPAANPMPRPRQPPSARSPSIRNRVRPMPRSASTPSMAAMRSPVPPSCSTRP